MSQSMGTIMPLMYGFFALSFSVGLSIYFIASNVIGIVQYAMMGKADFKRIFNIGGGSTPAALRAAQDRGQSDSEVATARSRSSNGKR